VNVRGIEIVGVDFRNFDHRNEIFDKLYTDKI